MRVITKNLTQVYGPLTIYDTGTSDPLIKLPDGFPMLDPFDPNEPYIASSKK